MKQFDGEYEQVILFDLLRTKERTVEAIPRDVAQPFIEKIHYSRKLPSNVTKTFGLYEGGGTFGGSFVRNSCVPVSMYRISRC